MNLKLRCIIVDDEPIARQYLEQYVLKISELELVQKCVNAMEAREVIQNDSIDLVFLDIQMPDLTGLELAALLETKPIIIFTTAYAEFAVEGFAADAIDYLLKPIAFDRFVKAVNKALELFTLKQRTIMPENDLFKKDYLLVKSDYKLIKVNYIDILFFEGLKEYIKIITKEGKPLVTLESMKNLETKLPQNDFIRVHKSYIVSIKNITAISGNMIELGKLQIPIGASYKEHLMEFLKR